MTQHKAEHTLHTLTSLFRELGLAWKLFLDEQVPTWTKAVPLLSLVYLIWPIDLISDPILGLGQLDDLVILLLGLKLFISLCPEEIVQKYRQGQATSSPPAKEEIVETSYRVLDEQEHPQGQ